MYGIDKDSNKKDYALDMEEDTPGIEVNSKMISNLHEVKNKTKEIKVII